MSEGEREGVGREEVSEREREGVRESGMGRSE